MVGKLFHFCNIHDAYRDDPIQLFLACIQLYIIDLLGVISPFDHCLREDYVIPKLSVLSGVSTKKVLNSASIPNEVTCHVSDIDFQEDLGDKHDLAYPIHTLTNFSKDIASKGDGLIKLSLLHCTSPYTTSMLILFCFRKGIRLSFPDLFARDVARYQYKIDVENYNLMYLFTIFSCTQKGNFVLFLNSMQQVEGTPLGPLLSRTLFLFMSIRDVTKKDKPIRNVAR